MVPELKLTPADCHDERRRIWSLLELVNNFSLYAFVSNMQNLSMQMMMFLGMRNETVEDGARARVVECVETLRTVISFWELPDSIEKIDTSLYWLRVPNTLGNSAIGTELRNITETVMTEASKKGFLYVQPDRVNYCICLPREITAQV